MRKFFLFCSFFFGLSAVSQNFESGLLPDFTLSYKISENYSIVHKIESRFPSYNSEDKNLNLDFERFDFQNFVQRKVGLFSKVALGFQYRIRNNATDEQRFIQQFSWVDKFTDFRIGHRLRSDQTLSEVRKPEFRFRYRASVQVPLQGQQLDQGEYYLSFSDELVWSYRSPEDDLENRIVTKIGLYINDKNKVEWGLDYRADGFFQDDVQHRLWINFGWYKAL